MRFFSGVSRRIYNFPIAVEVIGSEVE